MIACLGWLVYGDDKEGTNDGRAPFREETYDIGFYARNNARAPAVRAVLQETPTVFLSPSLPRSLFFSISRWSSKAGEEEGRERSGERKGSWSSFGALYRCGVVFLFSFFFSTLDERIWHEGKRGKGILHAYELFHSLFPRWILVQCEWEQKENFTEIFAESIALKEKRRGGNLEDEKEVSISFFLLRSWIEYLKKTARRGFVQISCE